VGAHRLHGFGRQRDRTADADLTRLIDLADRVGRDLLADDRLFETPCRNPNALMNGRVAYAGVA
jgi:hypothetical protein